MFLIWLPVVWRKAHANDVTVDINNMIQGIKKLVWTSLFAENRTRSGHLFRPDSLNAWKVKKELPGERGSAQFWENITALLNNFVTYLVRGVCKAAGGEEQVRFVFLPRLGRLSEAGVRGLRVGSAHQLSHLGFNLQLLLPHVFSALGGRRKVKQKKFN